MPVKCEEYNQICVLTPSGDFLGAEADIGADCVADGANTADITAVQNALAGAGAHSEIIAPHLGTVAGVPVTATFLTAASVMYDATYIPGGAASAATLRGNGDAVHFVEETYKHFKPIAAAGAPQAVQSGAPVGLTGTATDPNIPPRPLTLAWVQTSGMLAMISRWSVTP